MTTLKIKRKKKIKQRFICRLNVARDNCTVQAGASFVFLKSSEISTNMSSPTCLSTKNFTEMKWEQSKMLIPMRFTATHYSPYSGVKRFGGSNTTSHTAFLRGISLTMAKAL